MNPLIQSDPASSATTEYKKKYYKENPFEELWTNDVYQVNVRRNVECDVKVKGGITHLSIKRIDQGHLIDWRDMQEIKNQLVGKENEGMEMFPAESRLVDGANQFHMWVFQKKGRVFPWGFAYRLVTEDESIGNKQRPFENKPDDLDACTKIYLDHLKKMK